MRTAIAIAVIIALLSQPLVIFDHHDDIEQDTSSPAVGYEPRVPDTVPDRSGPGATADLSTPHPGAFTRNDGQLDNPGVRFYDPGGSVWFTDDGAWFDICDVDEVDGWVTIGRSDPSDPSDRVCTADRSAAWQKVAG